jgi:hypothetical protein
MLDGIILGLITFIGFWAIYRKLPKFVQRFMSHPGLAWIFDILLTFGAYLLLSKISTTFGSAVGFAITGILVSIYLSTQGEVHWKKQRKK